MTNLPDIFRLILIAEIISTIAFSFSILVVYVKRVELFRLKKNNPIRFKLAIHVMMITVAFIMIACYNLYETFFNLGNDWTLRLVIFLTAYAIAAFAQFSLYGFEYAQYRSKDFFGKNGE